MKVTRDVRKEEGFYARACITGRLYQVSGHQGLVLKVSEGFVFLEYTPPQFLSPERLAPGLVFTPLPTGEVVTLTQE